MALLHPKSLTILAAFAVIVGVNGTWGDLLDLHYESQDPQDTENIGLLRQALTKLGIDPNGIELIKFYQKWWVLGYSYRATYIDQDGRKCFIHFQWKKIEGLRVLEMPHCEKECYICGRKDELVTRKEVVTEEEEKIIISGQKKDVRISGRSSSGRRGKPYFAQPSKAHHPICP